MDKVTQLLCKNRWCVCVCVSVRVRERNFNTFQKCINVLKQMLILRSRQYITAPAITDSSGWLLSVRHGVSVS